MLHIFQKLFQKPTLPEAYKKMREDVMKKTGYYVAESLVLENTHKGDEYTLATVVLDSKEPLEFNPTFIPISSQYTSIVFNSEVLGRIKTDKLADLSGAKTVEYHLQDFGQIKFYQLDNVMNKKCNFKDISNNFS
jgi:hypothetical protein